MKKIYIISLLISLIVAAGCQKDATTEQDSNAPSVIITMDLESDGNSTRAIDPYSAQNGVLGGAEYVIDRLRVYVFASDGKLDKMEIYDDLNANHLIEKKITVPKDLSKELYFVANEPAAISDKLDEITSAEELEKVEFTIASEMNRGFNGAATFTSNDFLMPMTAKYSVKSALADIKIYVGLTRAVARVDLLLKKGSGASSRNVELNNSTTLSAEGMSYDSNLYEGTINEATGSESISLASSDITLSTSSAQRVLSFYTAERKYSSSSPITITVDGLIDNKVALDSKTVTLDDTNKLTELNRNYTYQITAYYNGSEIVADDLQIMEWVDVEVNGEIEGVLVAVDSEVAMDWLRNGNSYTSKSISFGSNKPIEFYLPVTVTNGDDAIPDYEFELFKFDNMSAGKSYNLKDITLNNNFIFATSWIESATIHFTSDRSGYIDFKYTPTKVNYKVQQYPIRIKSDNVTKQMKAVYDNGYLPASLLSDDWKLRAPGGVVFAKRGVAAHPVDTPKILYRDDDGYYRGEYSTTAEDATRYCQEKFGKDWYVPSYADMIEIASMFDMLGVSYRFQNNGSTDGSGQLTESHYWTSSASHEFPGKYWSGDFMKRDYIIDGFMERCDGSENHFVRCLMDLK